MGSNMVQIPPSVWQPNYQYFYMENSEGKNRISDKHLEEIEKNYDNILNDFYSFEGEKDYLLWIQNSMLKRKRECLIAEEAFVNELKAEHNDFIQAYHMLGNKSGSDSIRLFTDYFSLGKIEGKTSTPELSLNREQMDFKIAVSSREFVSAMKSDGPQGGYHYFSREKFAKAMGIGYTKKNGGLSKTAQKNVKDRLIKEIQDEGETEFWKSVYKSFDEVAVKGRQAELADFLNEARKHLVEVTTTFSDDYKEDLRDSFDSILEGGIKAGLINPDDAINGLNISLSSGGPTFLRITVQSRPGMVETLYKEKKNIVEAYKEAANIFYNAMGIVLDKMSMEKLDLLWIEVKTEGEKFKNNVMNYYRNNEGKIVELIKNIMGRDSSWEEKFKKQLKEIIKEEKSAYNFISGIIGIVGEFSSAIGYSSFSNLKVDANGAAHDKLKLQGENGTIEMKDFGQSFKDLVLNSKYGVNIKYYLSAGNEITLYAPKQDFKGYRIVGNDTLFKYIDAKTLTMMRFVEANCQYLIDNIKKSIDTAALDKSYLNISIANLGNFLRQSTTISDGGMNIFFQINNIIIPSSAIYSIILKSIEEERGMFKMNSTTNPWFKIIRKGTIPYDTYESINQSIIDKHYISNIKNNDYKGAVIYFKGLKISKEQLSSLI